MDAERILVRCPNWVGDVVMATPALRCLREDYPRATIAWVMKPYVRKLLNDLPWCDEIIEYDPHGEDKGTVPYLRLISRIRRARYDLAVILPNSFSSALMVWLGGVKRRVGYDRDRRGWMLTDRIAPRREGTKIVPVPMVEYYLNLCRHIGCGDVSSKPELGVSEEGEHRAEELFSRYGVASQDPVVVINPGASFGPSKLWKEDRFAQVGDALIARFGCRVFISCGPGEEKLARRIEAEMSNKPIVTTHEEVPLDVLKSVIKRCSLLVTVDSGPRHLAVAFDKPVVVIMGPTDPRYTAANLDKTTVLREELDCSPCHLKECPTDHRCMTLITPEKVLAAAEHLLRQEALRS